ncbi:uracil-DNA glycosylase [Stieleria varia]|uniref:Type-4 uracil-DNA glycosylase n=1 Tax=Stieleria varia TaxID=2528005 RepID=A0A5C6AZ43_9BACT|nr:uracil-DNA glycosylase [Stieleria varia]TWU04950.1 Uracil DNA glycosylase superfamily protein [Stieleria varia]
MNDSQSPLDALRVLQQASALAAHLQSQGVDWLPAADADEVQRLKDSFSAWAKRNTESVQTDKPSLPPSTGQPGGRETQQTAPAEPPKPSASPAANPPRQPAAPLVVTASNYPTPSLPIQQRADTLNVLSDQVAACVRCDALARCRTHTVFGEGDVKPRVVFFGEAPGRDEDLQGRPFVGRAGQLLTKMIEACSLSRQEVYILNTVKCRPPNNRNPEPIEIENCREYFEQQIQILQPEYIVCLGAISTQALLNNRLPLGQLRGTFHQYFSSKVVVTYHPAYLLRTPAAKKAAWTDLQMMMRDAGLK